MLEGLSVIICSYLANVMLSRTKITSHVLPRYKH